MAEHEIPVGRERRTLRERLELGPDTVGERHGPVAQTIAKQTPRGWRIDKASESDQVDAVVALAMAVDRATQPARESKILGWL